MNDHTHIGVTLLQRFRNPRQQGRPLAEEQLARSPLSAGGEGACPRLRDVCLQHDSVHQLGHKSFNKTLCHPRRSSQHPLAAAFLSPKPFSSQIVSGITLCSAPATCQEAAGLSVVLPAYPCQGEVAKGAQAHASAAEKQSKHPGLAELVCNTQLLHRLPLWPCKCLCRYRDLMLLPIVYNPSGLRRVPVSCGSSPVLQSILLS